MFGKTLAAACFLLMAISFATAATEAAGTPAKKLNCFATGMQDFGGQVPAGYRDFSVQADDETEGKTAVMALCEGAGEAECTFNGCFPATASGR